MQVTLLLQRIERLKQSALDVTPEKLERMKQLAQELSSGRYDELKKRLQEMTPEKLEDMKRRARERFNNWRGWIFKGQATDCGSDVTKSDLRQIGWLS